MSKFSLIGVLCWIGGVLTLGFQAISSLMGTDAVWENFTLIETFPPEMVDAIDNMSEGLIQSATDYIITAPLYIILFCAGTVLLVLSSILWRK
ncbi:MAG: hypothetical protein JRI91_01165 [Deltaproteobacteria bacterium]|nr:hypothetical protein [Deltaproteobacteria bacterium]